MNNKVVLLIICFMTALGLSAQSSHGVTGFATYQDLGLQGVTGGGSNAKIIHVSTREQFIQAVKGTTPRVVIVDADLTGKGMQDMNDEVALGSNLTILGAGSGHALNGFCLDGKGVQNVIIRNISLKKGRTDGIAFHNSHHIWIDHCDLSDSYDGLLDITESSDFVTVSWVKLHNHNKVSITNSGTCHYEDYNKEHITFAHCWFANNTQRNPRIGYGKMHIYNCYWTDISSYCIGFHSQAQVLSEYNYFTKTAKNPFCNQYTDALPYTGYLTDNGSYFANGKPAATYAHRYTGISYSPATYYSFDFDQSAVSNVPAETAGIGPKADLDKEPILCPGNGAIQIPVSQKLSWSNIDGATAYKVLFGTTKDNMTETDPNSISLKPATTYYWQVIASVNGTDHSSPVYQFTTAAEQPSCLYPTDGQKNPWLRWPTTRDQFCTALPLQWRPAFDAKSYKVYAGTSESDMQLVGETDNLQIVPDYKFLPDGKKYYWRVDVVKSDGSTVTGNTWSFSTSKKTFTQGENLTGEAYLSGIAFEEEFPTDDIIDGVRGDQGPGCIHAIWAGPAGKYAISTNTYDQSSGPNLVGVTVNDKLIDQWMTADSVWQYSTRNTRHTVSLNPGDEIRLDFVAGYVNGGLNESVAHIYAINFTPTTEDVIEPAAQNVIYHTPKATKGYEYENLPINSILFTDSLGTIGDYNSTQIKDMYRSWITMDDSKFTFYLTKTAVLELVYSDGSTKVTLDKTQNLAYDVAKQTADGTLTAVHLYKNLPTKTAYYTPVPDTGKDYQLLLSPAYLYVDSNGDKGEKGKIQVRPAYEEWIKYTNPSANEVQAKTGVKAFINPNTDAATSGMSITSSGCTYSYVAGTEKYMTYYVYGCQQMKFYYTGTAGTATNLYVETVEAGNPASIQHYEGEVAAGKNVASEAILVPLNATRQMQVKIQATTGDMLIYAVKLWPGDTSGINTVSAEDNVNAPLFNANGQRVAANYRGIVLRNGRKYVVK